MKPINPITYKRATWVATVVLVTASASGFFMGLRQTGSQLNPTQPTSLVSRAAAPQQHAELAHAAVAKGYSEQKRLADGPNSGWKNHLGNLIQPVVDMGSLTNVTDEERTAALEERASRRAYDGAPPVVPHAIAQDSAASCLACHGPGLAIKDKVASKISHESYTSCTQCHVPGVGPRIPVAEAALLARLAENDFEGVSGPGKGERAWPEAPPTIPHSTLMRSDCMSCHGPQGLFGLRTPHPDRQSCTQCHVPSADLDQRFFMPMLTREPNCGAAPSVVGK